jgi:hypothetical protein
MIYSLAFGRTYDGYLKIIGQSKEDRPLMAIHLNDQVFATAVSRAELPAEKAIELVSAAREAWLWAGRDICCVRVDMNPRQLQRLRFSPCESRLAIENAARHLITDSRTVHSPSPSPPKASF